MQTYAGIWAENAISGMCRDLLMTAIAKLDRVVLAVHDEIVVEGGNVDEVVGVMCQVPAWAAGLPIKAEGWQNEYLEIAIREEIKMFPKQALRELIANALVHQDFTIDGSPLRIEMYDDRVEISNPGKPTIPADRFIDEDRSRNERLAELMRRLGICERKGSGVDKVITAAEVFQLPAPEFRVGDIRTTSVLFSHQDFVAMSKQARVRACYQHCVLQFISGKRMSNQSLRDRFGLGSSGTGSSTASQIIAATKDNKLIKLDDEGTGSLKYARYVPWWG